jgi:flagellar hook-length control protein FliK
MIDALFHNGEMPAVKGSLGCPSLISKSSFTANFDRNTSAVNFADLYKKACSNETGALINQKAKTTEERNIQLVLESLVKNITDVLEQESCHQEQEAGLKTKDIFADPISQSNDNSRRKEITYQYGTAIQYLLFCLQTLTDDNGLADLSDQLKESINKTISSLSEINTNGNVQNVRNQGHSTNNASLLLSDIHPIDEQNAVDSYFNNIINKSIDNESIQSKNAQQASMQHGSEKDFLFAASSSTRKSLMSVISRIAQENGTSILKEHQLAHGLLKQIHHLKAEYADSNIFASYFEELPHETDYKNSGLKADAFIHDKSAVSEARKDEVILKPDVIDPAALYNSFDSNRVLYKMGRPFSIVTSDVTEDCQWIYDLIEKAVFSSKNNHMEMEVQLRPEHLGKMTMKVMIEDGIISAKITAHSIEIKNYIQSQEQELRDAFVKQGYQFAGLDVNVGQHHGNSNWKDNNLYFSHQRHQLPEEPVPSNMMTFGSFAEPDSVISNAGIDFFA